MAKPFGYLFVDHRASPGLPEDVARRSGYDPALTKEGKLYEADTRTCVHCNRPVIMNPERERERFYCMQCGGDYICDWCNLDRLRPDYVHMPFSKIRDLIGAGEATVLSLGVQPKK